MNHYFLNKIKNNPTQTNKAEEIFTTLGNSLSTKLSTTNDKITLKQSMKATSPYFLVKFTAVA